MIGGRIRARLVVALALGAAVLSICWLVAAPTLSPRTEEMAVGDVPVDVEYATPASAEQIGLPFYPDAQVGDSFAYTITSKDAKQVLSYASAVLTTPAAPAKVVAFYREALPGKPEAGASGDGEGARWVLAVGREGEVRTVTISPTPEGSRIELVRTTQPAVPARPIRPRERERAI